MPAQCPLLGRRGAAGCDVEFRNLHFLVRPRPRFGRAGSLRLVSRSPALRCRVVNKWCFPRWTLSCRQLPGWPWPEDLGSAALRHRECIDNQGARFCSFETMCNGTDVPSNDMYLSMRCGRAAGSCTAYMPDVLMDRVVGEIGCEDQAAQHVVTPPLYGICTEYWLIAAPHWLSHLQHACIGHSLGNNKPASPLWNRTTSNRRACCIVRNARVSEYLL